MGLQVILLMCLEYLLQFASLKRALLPLHVLSALPVIFPHIFSPTFPLVVQLLSIYISSLFHSVKNLFSYIQKEKFSFMSPAQRPNMPEPPPSPSSSSIFALSYLKLQLFARVRRFLQTKRAQKSIKTRTHAMVIKEEQATITTVDRQSSDIDDDSVVLQRSVKRLHFGSWEEKEMAALEIEKLAREDAKMRNLMAELGVIPALVGMVASEVAGRQRVAVNALIELANGTYK